MKKILTVIISAILATSLCVPAFADETETPAINSVPPLQMYGIITDITDETLTVKNESGDDSVILNLLDSTWIIDAETGGAAGLLDRETDRVSVYYGPVTTRSIPPRGNAVAIILNLPEETYAPYYSVVESVTRDENGVKILTNGGSLYVTILEDSPISPFMTLNIVTVDDIDIGTELLLWYNVVLTSYPGQTASNKTIILSTPPSGDNELLEGNAPSDKIILVPQAGTASVNGNEVDLAGISERDDGSLLLPMRQLSEALGYEVKWITGTSSVEISRDAALLTLEFGNPNIRGTRGEGFVMTLEHAPVVINNVTYVSPDFFSAVLNVELIINSFE